MIDPLVTAMLPMLHRLWLYRHRRIADQRITGSVV
jgi:hypothetical protein